MLSEITVLGKNAVEIVTCFVREVLGKGAGFIPAETIKCKEHESLWIVCGEIRYMGDYTYICIHFSELVDKSPQELIDILNNLDLTKKAAKKVIESLKDFKFRFYVDPKIKKLYALNLDFGEADFSDKINYTIREKDIDAKDICKEAKEFLSKATTFRYFDFLPIFVICDADRWKIMCLASYYTGFDIIPRLYYFEYSRDGAFRSFKGF